MFEANRAPTRRRRCPLPPAAARRARRLAGPLAVVRRVSARARPVPRSAAQCRAARAARPQSPPARPGGWRCPCACSQVHTPVRGNEAKTEGFGPSTLGGTCWRVQKCGRHFTAPWLPCWRCSPWAMRGPCWSHSESSCVRRVGEDEASRLARPQCWAGSGGARPEAPFGRFSSAAGGAYGAPCAHFGRSRARARRGRGSGSVWCAGCVGVLSSCDPPCAWRRRRSSSSSELCRRRTNMLIIMRKVIAIILQLYAWS